MGMNKQLVILLLLVAWVSFPATPRAETNNADIAVSRRFDVSFSRPAPYSTPKEINRRLGISAGGRASALATEKFQIVVPGTFSTNLPCGLFVWISPGDTPKIPSTWEAELAKAQMLFVGAYKSGNQRLIWERMSLALGAVFNLSQMYRIDTNRIIIAGFSGGGRVAGMMGIGYPDVFTGAICVCGVSFYTDIQTTTGTKWERMFIPEANLLTRAKSSGRFVLLTGDLDINRDNTHEVWRSGFEREGFLHVRYVESPGLQHALPSAEVFQEALRFVAAKGSP